MPRYFIDLLDDDAFFGDADGSECPSHEAARLEAARILVEVARDSLGMASLQRQGAVTVRDSSGRKLWTVKLALETMRY